MKDRRLIFIYGFLSIVMLLFPIFNLFSFVTLILLYKNSNSKVYNIFCVMVLGLFLGFFSDYSPIIPIIISYIAIKSTESGRKFYETVFIMAVIMAILLTTFFMIIRLNTEYYNRLLDAIKLNIESMNIGNNSMELFDFEKNLNIISDYYPSVAFATSYIISFIGYAFIRKKAENRIDGNDYISPIDYKFLLVLIVLGFIFNISSESVESGLNNAILSVYTNFIICLCSMLFVQGFAVINVKLKKRVGLVSANLISILSIFFVLSYIGYFVYGLNNSIVRGLNNGKKIS